MVADEIRSVRVAALARAKEADIKAAGKALASAARPVIHVFLATSAIHLKYKLKTTPEEALRQAVESVRLARSFVPEVEFSAEDASRSDYGYLRQVLQAVHEAGAQTLNVPDTVGYSLPHEYAEMVEKLVRDIPSAIISVHCHNDLGLAVANSLAAVRAGARQVECTINGIGERAGNAALEEVVMALRVRAEALGCETAIDVGEIGRVSQIVSELTGYNVQRNKAIVGANAFAHEAGIHQDGMLKDATTYQIMDPGELGLTMTLPLGKHSGRHAFRRACEEAGMRLSDGELAEAFVRFKDLADTRKAVTLVDVFQEVAA
jgi:2-isopropylmalate synthase